MKFATIAFVGMASAYSVLSECNRYNTDYGKAQGSCANTGEFCCYSYYLEDPTGGSYVFNNSDKNLSGSSDNRRYNCMTSAEITALTNSLNGYKTTADKPNIYNNILLINLTNGKQQNLENIIDCNFA